MPYIQSSLTENLSFALEMLPLTYFSLTYVDANDMAVIDCPEFNLQRIRILLLESFEEDSVPKTQVNVPLEPFITPSEEAPGSADVGIPAPLYAANISAHPFVPDNEEVHEELSGIHTQHPA